MRTFRCALIALVFLLGWAPAHGGQPAPGGQKIGPLVVTPRTVTIAQPSIVEITAPILDTSVVPNSVHVFRLAATGHPRGVLGTLHDDGEDGDALANDGIFTLRVTINEMSPIEVRLQVFAAFKGGPPSRSDAVSVYAQPANAPDLALAATAERLDAGDLPAVLTRFRQTAKSVDTLMNLDATGRSLLAAALRSAELFQVDGDLRIYRGDFVTPTGERYMVEFWLRPNIDGEWIISNW